MRISSNSNAGLVAGAIAGSLREDGVTELEMIGASAVYKGICALSIANTFLADDGITTMATLSATNRNVGGIEKRCFLLKVKADGK